MESLLANKPLLYSLLVSASAVVALASGLLPELMTQFQLVDFDTEVSLSSKNRLVAPPFAAAPPAVT